jgi:hypothetical protein
LGVACCLSLTGCGGNKPVPVSGVVKIDGQPLTRGHIWVMPAKGRAAVGEIDSQGHFTLTTNEPGDGCYKGTHKVTVASTQQINPSRVKHLIPTKYREPSTTDKTVTIDGPTDNLVIELTWGGGQPYIEESHGGGDVAPALPAGETSESPAAED